MKYVLQRTEDGAFVARSGSEQSYTKQLQKARLFPSREAAQADACGNERILTLDEAAGA